MVEGESKWFIVETKSISTSICDYAINKNNNDDNDTHHRQLRDATETKQNK